MSQETISHRESLSLSRVGGCLLACIHPIADKEGSRKPLFTPSDAYALGPVLRVDSSPEERFRADSLLHVWMDIHS